MFALFPVLTWPKRYLINHYNFQSNSHWQQTLLMSADGFASVTSNLIINIVIDVRDTGRIGRTAVEEGLKVGL